MTKTKDPIIKVKASQLVAMFEVVAMAERIKSIGAIINSK